MIWVEVLSRHQDVIERFRCDDEARIGRAYDNDVVLDDPFVAPHHLRIARDEDGTLHAEDLGSANGLFIGDGDIRQARIALDGQRILRAGRTLLRVRDSAFTVAPERPVGRVVRTWPINTALALVVACLTMLTLWLNETHEMQPSRYLLPLFGVALVVLVWTTGWAVLSRIFTGIAHFERHLLIALAGLLAFFLLDEVSDYASFAFSSRIAAEYAYIGNWALFALLCFAHLRAMGPGRQRTKGGVVAALALAAIAAQGLSRSDDTSAVGQQSYLQGLKPPMFRLKRPQPLDTFLESTGSVKDAIDKARLEPPGGRGWFDSDDSDPDN